MRIHLVPGVAADHRIFQKLELQGHDLKVLELPHMDPGATIGDYASTLASQVDRQTAHVLIGMSMGGMIVQEMAALTEPVQVIIISSWKSPEEMPLPIRTMRGTHPERVVSPKFIDRIRPLLFWQMGAESEEDKALIDSFLHTMPIDQIKAQLHASLNWNGPQVPLKELVHIHGDNDHLMPIGDIQNAIPVAGGGHIMVYNRAVQVSDLIIKHLKVVS